MKKKYNYWEERMANSQKLTEKQVTKRVEKLYKSLYKQLDSDLTKLWLEMMELGEVSGANLLRLDRYAKLKANIDKKLSVIAHTVDNGLQTSLTDVFIQSWKDQLGYLGLGEEYVQVDNEVARQVVLQNYKTASFSERVWESTINPLKTQLDKEIMLSAVAGKDIRKVTKDLQSALNKGYNECRRIAVTETARVQNDACIQSAIETGLYTHFKFLAHIDDKTCPKCKECDGKTYPLNDGEHRPPLHPNSRSTITIVLPT